MGTAGEVEVTPLERSYFARALAVVACAVFVAMLFREWTASLLWMAYGCFFLVAATFGATVGSYVAGRALRVRLDQHGVHLNDALLARREDLVSGRVLSRPIWMTTKLLVLTGREGTPSYLFRVADEATGRACLEQLHLDPRRVRVTRTLPWIPFGRVDGSTFILLGAVWSVLLVPMLALSLFDGPSAAHDRAMTTAMIVGLALHLTFWISLRLRSPVSLEIGHDGLVVTSGIVRRTTRVIPYDDVQRIVPWKVKQGPVGTVSQGIDLMMREGPPVHLHTRSAANQGLVDEVAGTLEDAWMRHRRRRLNPGTPADVRLEREGRRLEEWTTALTRVGSGAASYRDLGADPQTLLEVLDDQTASAELRAAAAFALTATAEPELHHRVRVAADTVAAPELRGTLEALAAADEESRVEALGRLRR
jgi:hypothetical protein